MKRTSRPAYLSDDEVPDFLKDKLNLQSTSDLNLLSSHDTDLFNRWNSNRRYFTDYMLKLIGDYRKNKKLIISQNFIDNFEKLLTQQQDNLELYAMMLQLPSAAILADKMVVIDPAAITVVREFVMNEIVKECEFLLLQLRSKMALNNSAGSSSVKNVCLNYLIKLNDAPIRKIAVEQFYQALDDNMTDTIAAMSSLVSIPCEEKSKILNEFYKKWHDDPNVMEYWFKIQASSDLPGTLDNIKNLLKHPAFDIRNPKNVDNLIGVFAKNLPIFHKASGKGYELLADLILQIDAAHPSISSGFIKYFADWPQFDARRQQSMQYQLLRIKHSSGISAKLHEMVSKTLEVVPVDASEQKIPQKVPQVYDNTVHKQLNSVPTKEQLMYGATLLGGAALTAYGLYQYLKQPEKTAEDVVEVLKKKL